MGLIKMKSKAEGYFFLRWLHNRLINQNKNVLSAELGATGSGKSYRDLRKAELWYHYHFNEKFPEENICFSIPEVIKLISSGKLRRGEIIIFEEAGANLGSLDFQTKVSKMFTYVLQSFRSMNIALFMNLPYLSMLNKQARMLLHYYGESKGVDKSRKINKCSPMFLQIAQSSGKVYRHHPKYTNLYGEVGTLGVMCYSMPSKYLIDAYEHKKEEFLHNLTSDFTEELEKTKVNGARVHDGRKMLTKKQEDVLKLQAKYIDAPNTNILVSKDLGMSDKSVSVHIKAAWEKDWSYKDFMDSKN